MNKKPDKLTNGRSDFFFVYATLIFVVFVTTGMSVVQSYVVYPRFLEELILNTEKEAVRTGNHLQRRVLETSSNGEITISEKTKTYLENTAVDYGLWKIKIFSGSGKTIYSTSAEDLGVVNEKPYFHRIIAKGNIYTKVVEKDGVSLEDQIVTSDIVETYIPIMNHDNFIGAFEIYFDITASKNSMEKLISRSNNLLYGLNAIIVVVAVFVSFRFRQSLLERKRCESALFENMMKQEKLSAVIKTAGAVCHEMNQPLMVVLGHADLLMEDKSEGDPDFPSLQEIKAHTERLGEITRQLMEINDYKTKDYLNNEIVDIAASSQKDNS